MNRGEDDEEVTTQKRTQGPIETAERTDAVEQAGFEEADRLSTAPIADTGISVPRLGTFGLLRWIWRQLTSMRIALTLLFLLLGRRDPRLAAAAARDRPDARSSSSTPRTQGWAPFLDRLQLFDVFESAWFGAIYCLLFVSLVGCILPAPAGALPGHARPPAAGPAQPQAAARARLVPHRRPGRRGARPRPASG